MDPDRCNKRLFLIGNVLALHLDLIPPFSFVQFASSRNTCPERLCMFPRQLFCDPWHLTKGLHGGPLEGKTREAGKDLPALQVTNSASPLWSQSPGRCEILITGLAALAGVHGRS